MSSAFPAAHLHHQIFYAEQSRIASHLAEPSIDLLGPLRRIRHVQRRISKHVRTVRLAAAADGVSGGSSSDMGGPLTT